LIRILLKFVKLRKNMLRNGPIITDKI